MPLDPVSAEHLKHLGTDCEVVDGDGCTWVVLKRQRLPEGYNSETADVLIQLPDGFPDAAPDMFWTDPILTVGNGSSRPPQTGENKCHLGRKWQRWSRHIRGHWRPGIDNIRSYVAYIHRCLAEAAAGAAN